MARVSFLFALIAALATLSFSNAFAPAPAFGCVVRQETALSVKVKIDVGDGEPIESAIRRFKREVNKSGHLIELRHKRYFENSQERIKRKVKEGRMRKKFERMQRRRTANRV